MNEINKWKSFMLGPAVAAMPTTGIIAAKERAALTLSPLVIATSVVILVSLLIMPCHTYLSYVKSHLKIKPEIIQVLALPNDYMVVFEGNEIKAVLNENDVDVFKGSIPNYDTFLAI